MNKFNDITEAAYNDDEIDALLSLQTLESDNDQGMVQMFSSSSCVMGSCLGS